jgi:hypothetical protein
MILLNGFITLLRRGLFDKSMYYINVELKVKFKLKKTDK